MKQRDNHWMERAFAHVNGQLRRKTHTKAGRNITVRALNRKSKSRNTRTRRQAVLARIARRINSNRSSRS